MSVSDESELGSENRPTGNDVQYLFHVVKTVRGREASTAAKLMSQGWEFVSQNQGTLRTEMTFRRVKPKDPLQRLSMLTANGWTAFRRLSPKTQRGAVAVLGALAMVGMIGIVVSTLGGGDTPDATAAPVNSSTTPPADPDATPATAPAEPSAASSTPPTEQSVTNVTVDELVEKMNSANLGGMKVGDQFRLTGELTRSDLWTTGASGDFFVTLKTKAGADLIVFVEESDADGWQDGTKVQMIVQHVEVTINGETTDGWLEAKSVKAISGGTTKEAKEDDAGQTLSDALSDYVETLNRSAGATIIDSIDPGSTSKAFHINLNMGFATLSKLETQATIKTMNGQLVDIAADSGSVTPILKYYLAGEEVAENRYLIDPWDVRFKGLLGD